MTEREQLEARANALGVKFPKNIGDAKLAEKVTAAEGDNKSSKPPADQAKGKKTRATDPAGGAIVVTGPKKGRWRAGRYFGHEPVEIPIEELSKKDAKKLASDPQLTIEEKDQASETK